MSVLIISGITGSLGKAILKHQNILQAHGITKIRGISRDEQKQVSLQRDYGGLLPLDCYLGDVTDSHRMMFALKDADYVVHAAAQKHIDKFELDVPMGYKTNIRGAESVADGFLNSKNAKKAIFVSTDKAALPITSYGISKLAAEHLWLWNNTYQKQILFKVARYGNIFASRGSVIELWSKLAKEGKSLPITNPECTRFFMPVEEAAEFVLHTLFDDQSGLRIPKMKSIEMVKVADLIWREYQNSPLQHHEIGMRSIEKVHEILDAGGLSSADAERFSEEELRALYHRWKEQDAPRS